MNRLIVFALWWLGVFAQWSARAPVNHTAWEHFFAPRVARLDDMIPVPPEPTTIRSRMELPPAIDWRSSLGPAREQGECGSCWAFAGVAALEHALYQRTGTLVDLSEQHLVDCAWLFGNRGCRGGQLAGTLRFLVQGAVCNETQYPYSATATRLPPFCKNVSRTRMCASTPRVRQLSLIRTEQGLQTALVQGPVVIAMHVNAEFHTYAEGIYDGPCAGSVNHAVLLVGYNTSETGVPYWIVRNSWGTDWGEQGYVRIVRHRRWCRIGDYVGYQIVRLTA